MSFKTTPFTLTPLEGESCTQTCNFGRKEEIFRKASQQRKVLDILPVDQRPQLLFQHDPVAGVGGVAEGGLDAALHKVGRAAHRHRQAVPGQKAAGQHAGKQVAGAGVGDRDIVAQDAPEAVVLPVIADVGDLPRGHRRAGDDHIVGAQLAQPHQQALGLGAGEALGEGGDLEQHAGLGQVGGDDVGHLHQLPQPRAHPRRDGAVGPAVVAHHRVHHRKGVLVGGEKF